jgi:hypothetical protein
VIFVTLNNWQRGDYKPYVVKTTDRGRTWTNITGDLPDKHDVWTIAQDRINANLLFLGTEFGLFFTVDGGSHWTQLKGGLPTIQVRDLVIHERENDVVLATFGRGFYVLDDYTALRDVNAQTLTEEARLFPLRDAYSFTQTGMAPAGTAGIGSMSGNWVTPNPPFGAVFTYNVAKDLPADSQLVLTINDDTGKQVRRLTLEKTAGLRRVAWNLRPDAPTPARTTDEDAATSDDDEQQPQQQRPTTTVVPPIQAPQQPGGRGGQAGAQGAGGFGGGRGGGVALVPPGRYQAVLGKMVGDKVTPVGPAQNFLVVQIPQ